jgi:hypothetical protein
MLRLVVWQIITDVSKKDAVGTSSPQPTTPKAKDSGSSETTQPHIKQYSNFHHFGLPFFPDSSSLILSKSKLLYD